MKTRPVVSAAVRAGVLAVLAVAAASCGMSPWLRAAGQKGGGGRDAVPPRQPAWVVHPDTPGERRLTNVRQLTFGGDNAEAYWSWKGDRLVFQMSRRNGVPCDQIFTMNADGTDERLVSNGKGRTTCPYFLPGDDEIVYASTHHAGDECPKPPPAVPGGYTWPLFDYDLYVAKADGTDVRSVFSRPGYDAEATVGPDGTILFTSDHEGDLELYTMRPDGSELRRLTHTLGYDGGAFFSKDGTKIVYRASHPRTPEEVATYKRLLAARWVQPTRMHIFVMDADGSNQRQVTDLAGSSFAPFFTPDGTRILFASNWQDPSGWKFDLWLVNLDGTGLEQVTFAPEFDSFPMFSPDGRQLVWESNRFNPPDRPRDTNVFLADWVE